MELKLYQLPEQYEKIMNLDVDEETTQMMLKSLNHTLEEKAENLARVMRTMDAGINAIKEEKKRLNDRFNSQIKALENKQEWLKEYLLQNMKAMNIEIIKTNTDTIYISGRDYSRVVDREKLPQEYVKQKITVSVDKRKLNKDIKTKDIPGVEVEHKEWVVIR